MEAEEHSGRVDGKMPYIRDMNQYIRYIGRSKIKEKVVEPDGQTTTG